MKSIFVFIMLFPVLLLGQDIASATNASAESFKIDDFIYNNQVNNRLPNTATKSEMSASAAMMGCFGLIVELDPSAGVSGPQNCSLVTNGIEIDAYSEGLSTTASVGPGTPISAAPPAIQQVSFTRESDVNSAQFRSLLVTGQTIPYIEIFLYTSTSGANPDHYTKYENCIITNIQESGTSLGFSESITFAFTKACYKSYELDSGGAIISETAACVDYTLTDQSTCSCD